MKTKKWISLFLVAIALIFCTACEKTEPPEEPTPDENQLKSICQLSVLEGYYHNVVKYYNPGQKKGFLPAKDTNFWVEYTGVARYGLDVSKLKMSIQGKNITIEIPKAQILYCKVDSTSLNQDAYIIAKDSAKVTSEDSKKALIQAQNELREKAENDETLLTMAQDRAQTLMESYIKNLTSVTGTDAEQYTIKWVILDE